ncbi:LysM peptidoglycan-binding domain-containing protein [Desulforamulus aquiferis]|uniref:LysM peptidoglycan-binding domain-containing protein n=1 Tax=Desulforamulus aquiferis TaxID=1397668 RepID=A0AAW7ZDC6_9FIRM|nr:LysM peptidoglycan-binding domain-containing protein [Desulforamulus aquiferis]MDO7787703.1 LysM peptidoglycan-binding domain-containing protein [Desulforamulus aquiferis]RYD03739.1 hypothetical protein N752_18500 [Desulforamulus aquiferis]
MGKKVTQVEQELKSQKKYTVHILFGILVLVVILMAANIFTLKQEIVSLKVERGSLLEENSTLKIEVETIKLAEGQKQVEIAEAVDSTNGQGSIIYHHIQAGDNLPSISKRYYGTEIYARQLAQINGHNPNSLLHIGQILQVPREPDPAWGN